MKHDEILVVPTGTANLASVLGAFARQGRVARLERDPLALREARHVVLPGVGAFGAVARALDHGLRNTLRRRIEADRPTLGICVGLQLFGLGSEESPGARGLGLVPVHAARFPKTARTPQLGWNRVTPDQPGGLVEAGWAYFANSYALRAVPAPWAAATSEYSERFVAAFEHGSVLACQFHPELSGAYGAALLTRWLQRSAA